MTTLEEEVRRIAKLAAEAVEEGIVVIPTFFVEGDDGVIRVCPFQYSGTESKDAAVAVVKLMARACRAVRIVYVSEAWVTPHRNAQEAQAALLPSDDPNREEALILTGEDLAGQVSGSMKITRAEGKATVGPLELMDHYISRFSDLLPGKQARQ